MKQRFNQLLEQFLAANTATKVTLALATLMTVAVVGVATMFANRPDYVEHFSGLSAAQATAYKAALAEAGIPFKSSPPPGPFSIWIDSGDTIAAEAQVARGGYQPEAKGIQTSAGGAQSAFLSAGERDAMMDKRQWQECELLLETLEFVERATVQVSRSKRSPFRKEEPPTVAVTLDLHWGVALNSSQARNVASLVRGRFNVPLENITILDGTTGELLHDGQDLAGGGGRADLLEHRRHFEKDAERKANEQLERAFGPGLAYATVTSDWSLEETESVRESALPGAETYKSKIIDETTQGGGGTTAGGPAGVSANITQDFGNENAAVGGGGAGGGATRNHTMDETRSVVGRETQHRVSRTPQLKRMSVSVVFDQSLPQEKVSDLDALVKAAVGFDDGRDTYKSLQYALADVVRDEDGNPVPVEHPEPPAEPNKYVELLLTHGVEALAGLAFLVVLLKTLKGGKAKNVIKSEAEVAAEEILASHEAQERIEEELRNADPELLARMQVEELVKSEPERVSEILAQWATEDSSPVGAGQ